MPQYFAMALLSFLPTSASEMMQCKSGQIGAAGNCVCAEKILVALSLDSLNAHPCRPLLPPQIYGHLEH
jgi:hypothetical protein